MNRPSLRKRWILSVRNSLSVRLAVTYFSGLLESPAFQKAGRFLTGNNH